MRGWTLRPSGSFLSMGHKVLFPRPSSDPGVQGTAPTPSGPGSRPPAFTCSGPRLSGSWGCLGNRLKKGPGFQGLALSSSSFTRNWRAWSPSKVPGQCSGRSYWQVRVKRWEKALGRGQRQAELTWDEASASSLSGGCETVQNSGHRGILGGSGSQGVWPRTRLAPSLFVRKTLPASFPPWIHTSEELPG